MNTMGIPGAAEYLNVSQDTMRELAATGAVAGAKVGKEWVFFEDDLEEFLRKEIKRQTSERRGEPTKPVDTTYQQKVRRGRIAKRVPSLNASFSRGPSGPSVGSDS